jgi:hypothetical protein
MCGCAGLAKKFVRKQKKQEKPQAEMVLDPEVYSDSQANKEDAYRQYFTFWSSWHDELIDTLADQSPNIRRQLDNIQEAINNLSEMHRLLTGDKQTEAASYLVAMNSLKAEILQDIYGNNMWSTRKQAESLKRQINRALQYKQVKDTLK